MIDRKSTRLNSSHTEIYTLSLHDALPIYQPTVPGEPVVGVERVVAEVLVGRAAKLVRPGACDDADLRARRPPELGGVSGGEDAHLLQRLGGGQRVRAAERGEGGERAPRGLAGRGPRAHAEVGRGAVHGEVV